MQESDADAAQRMRAWFAASAGEFKKDLEPGASIEEWVVNLRNLLGRVPLLVLWGGKEASTNPV